MGYDAKVTKCFQNLFARIITDIAGKSKDVVEELKWTGDWNYTMNPKVKSITDRHCY